MCELLPQTATGPKISIWALIGFLRLWVCVLTLVIPDDEERAPGRDCVIFRRRLHGDLHFWGRVQSSSDILCSEVLCTTGLSVHVACRNSCGCRGNRRRLPFSEDRSAERTFASDVR